MKLEEARKLATPGPILVDRGQIGIPLHDAELGGDWCTTTEQANAVLLAHCYNHFDEVVAALERVLSYCSGPNGEDYDAPIDAYKVLARAKEVT